VRFTNRERNLLDGRPIISHLALALPCTNGSDHIAFGGNSLGMELFSFLALNASPDWLNSGDTAWQLMSATLVGIMSVPGLAILYAGLMKRKWALNSALMVLYAFSMTLVVWTLFAYNMGFGSPAKLGPGVLSNLIGIPGSILGAGSEQGRASIPLLSGLMPDFRFPGSALVYFQSVSYTHLTLPTKA